MMPVDAHLKRIERESGVPGLTDALAQLAPTDLNVFERQAGRRDAATLLAQYERARRRLGAAPSRVTYPLADGGRIDWTQRLLSDRKERLLTSAIGISLVSLRFIGA